MNRKHVPALVAYILVALVASIVIADRADAVAEDATPTPVVKYPVGIKPGNNSGVTRLHVEGAIDKARGLRKFIRESDRALPGMRITRHGSCAERPRAVCVQVVVDDFDNNYYASVLISPDPTATRYMHFNSSNPHYLPQAVAAHEFGHILGLGHHAKRGVCGGEPDELHLSRVEKRVLRKAY